MVERANGRLYVQNNKTDGGGGGGSGAGRNKITKNAAQKSKERLITALHRVNE